LKQYEKVFKDHNLLASLQKKSPSYEVSPDDRRSLKEDFDIDDDFEEGNRTSSLMN
jgi:hypothetical protein